jgi:hypothetical protein
MIFPNHPMYAELTASMGELGYQPGAHSLLGYTAPTHALGYAAGSNALGDFSASMENAAVDAGISTNDIDLLNSLGATDQDLSDLINGNITLTALYAKYGVTIPGGGGVVPTTPSSASITPPQGPSPASAGQVPSGSTLLYTATVNTPPLTSAQDIVNAIAPGLPGHGMSLISSQVSKSGSVSGPASFSVTVMDSVGHALVSDAKSVLDGLVQNYLGAGNLQLQSSLNVVSAGTTASGQPQATAAASPVAWLESNALWIGGAVAALVLLNNFTGGKRR